MAFTDFKDINLVLQKYNIKARTENIVPSPLRKSLPDWFIENLSFTLEIKKINESEAFLREGFIFPFLQEGIKSHRTLNLWSHQFLKFDDDLSGYPDYFITLLPYEKGYLVMDNPYVAVVEAKEEKLHEGWGQCLSAMIACRKLNDKSVTIPTELKTKIKLYGIVSTGLLWEFGKLENDVFIKHRFSYSIEPPEVLMGVLDYILADCEQQGRSLPS